MRVVLQLYMKYKFNPAIVFYGRCEEALEFYKEQMNGEIPFLSRFEDSAMEVAPEFKRKIIHAEFQADGVFFMASDGLPPDIGQKPRTGNITLSINFTEVAEEERLFKALSINGEVIDPLQDQFWGARYGSVVDQFGVRWECNCQFEQTDESAGNSK